jgi:hypothetical protein
MANNGIKKLTLSATFLAMGFILPMFFGNTPLIGRMLLPMHLPIFLCALICDWKHGLCIGLILPLLRSALLSVPVFYPTAISVALEMATYGAVSGIIYSKRRSKSLIYLYAALLVSMIAGRMVSCVVEMFLLGIVGNTFVFQTFLTGTLLYGIPGIIIQLILIPAVMTLLKKTTLPWQKK